MKKVILLFMTIFILCSCSNSNFAMKKKFADENEVSLSKVKLEHDFGKFNDSRVVYITSTESNYIQTNLYRYVGDKIFYSPDGYEVLVYNNKNFYNLADAYSKQILSLDDIHALYDSYNEYNDFTSDFVHYLEFINLNIVKENVSNDGLITPSYSSYISYGNYAGSNVYMFTGMLTRVELDTKCLDYTFKHYDSDVIMVLKDNKYYSLKDALDSNIITESNLKDIYDTHKEKYEVVYFN